MSVNLSQPSFVHLRCHSEYSFVDGTVRIDDYVAHAVKDQMPALALTDLLRVMLSIDAALTGIRLLII
jgi:DNA polymerase-3 subunit alpha